MYVYFVKIETPSRVRKVRVHAMNARAAIRAARGEFQDGDGKICGVSYVGHVKDLGEVMEEVSCG